MDNLYRVIYNTTDNQTKTMPVYASSQPNAVAKVKVDDSTFKELVSITEHIHIFTATHRTHNG